MRDIKKMSRDLNNYHNAVRKLYSEYQYIDIVELSNNMNYHTHAIMLFSHELSNAELSFLSDAWHNKSEVYIDKIDSSNRTRVINYLTQYSTHPVNPTENEIDCFNYHKTDYACYDEQTQAQIKHYVKNMRLFYLPRFARIYRTSSKTVKPIRMRMTAKELEHITEHHELMFSETITVSNDKYASSYYY